MSYHKRPVRWPSEMQYDDDGWVVFDDGLDDLAEGEGPDDAHQDDVAFLQTESLADRLIASLEADEHKPNTLELDFAQATIEPDGSRILLPVEILGVPHHLVLLKVTRGKWHGRRLFDEPDLDGSWAEQVGATYDNERVLGPLQDLVDAETFTTVKVPGHDGDYVTYLHPYGD